MVKTFVAWFNDHGIVGGGRNLGRMMAIVQKKWAFKVGVLDPVSDCPAAQVAEIGTHF